MSAPKKPVVVLGAGIAGVSAAVEAAEAGAEVILVERAQFIGGRVVANHGYFPKLCPPTCGMEINVQRIERNPRIRVVTGATVVRASKKDRLWSIAIAEDPKYVNERCTACNACAEACPARIADPFNLGMCEVPAIRLPYPGAWPQRFALDRDACPKGCEKCVEACKYGAIDLDAKPKALEVEAGAVIVATGWTPYPIENLPELGGGVFEDVIANVQMERLASPTGPTRGRIARPSNGEPPKKVAFVQCAGSRDVNHLPYCSAVCCLASLKQAIYVREQLPDAEVEIYYIDRRAFGRNEDLLARVAKMDRVKMVKGKVGKVVGKDGALLLRLEDVESGLLVERTADLVVLATGMVPNAAGLDPLFEIEKDGDGFCLDTLARDVVAAGVARRPQDVAASVRDATGAAAKAVAAARRGA